LFQQPLRRNQALSQRPQTLDNDRKRNDGGNDEEPDRPAGGFDDCEHPLSLVLILVKGRTLACDACFSKRASIACTGMENAADRSGILSTFAVDNFVDSL
jgi:hypothetical protein